MDCIRSPGTFGVLAGECWGSPPLTREVPEFGAYLGLEMPLYICALVPQAVGCMLQEDPFGPMTLQFCAGSWLPQE